MRVHFFIGVLSLVIMACANDEDPCGKNSTLCRSDFDIPFEKDFRPSCYRYGICLDCGVKKGYDKDWCDTYFLRLLQKVCQDNLIAIFTGDSSPFLCANSLNRYYRKLIHPSMSTFKNESEAYCTESWVSDCLYAL